MVGGIENKDERYKQIGQLKVELEFLKNRAGLVDSRPPPRDRSASSTVDHPAAMRTAGPAALDLQLPAAAGERREPAPAARTGSVVPKGPVLRQPQDGGGAGCESQTHPASDAHFGDRSPLSLATFEPPGTGPRGVSVLAARCDYRAPQPGLEHRYYVRSDARWLPVLSRRDGLVQPLRAQLGVIPHHGDGLLPGGAGDGLLLRPARNLELRSGRAVHRRLPGAIEAARHRHQHGWAWPRRQTCSRTDSKGREHHSEGGRGPPPPWDLALFLSRVDAFRFTRFGACRTIDLLDSTIGLSRDGTRAPIQARSGWRPSGRLLVSPLHHLRTADFLSKRWGPPH